MGNKLHISAIFVAILALGITGLQSAFLKPAGIYSFGQSLDGLKSAPMIQQIPHRDPDQINAEIIIPFQERSLSTELKTLALIDSQA